MASRKNDDEATAATSEIKVEKDALDDVLKSEPKSPKKGLKGQPTAAPVRRRVGRPRKAAKVAAAAAKQRPYSTRSVVAKSRSSDESSNPVALLDMLAEVASATLEKDQLVKRRRRGRKSSTKLQRKSSSQRGSGTKAKTTMSSATNRKKKLTGDGGGGGGEGGGNEALPDRCLSLDQIRVLPDKTLLLYFAELTADEIRRNYSYVCFLMPDKCSQKYTSFGNDNRARMQMKSHLLGHIAELLADATSHGRGSQKSRFTAEPLAARKHRLMSIQENSEESGGGGGESSAWKKRAVDGRSGRRGNLKSMQAKKWKQKRSIASASAPVAAVAVTTKKGDKRVHRRAVKRLQISSTMNKAEKNKPDELQFGVEPKPKGRRRKKVLREETEVLEEEVVHEEIFFDEIIYDDVCGGSGIITDAANDIGEVITVVPLPLHDHSYTINRDRKRRHDEDEVDYGQEDNNDADGDYDQDGDPGDVQIAYICVEQTNGDGSGGEGDEDNDNAKDDAAVDEDGRAVASVNQVESSKAAMALRQLEAIRLLQMQKNKKAPPVVVEPAAPATIVTAAAYPSSSSSASTTVANTATLEIDANTIGVIRIDVPRSGSLAVDGIASTEHAVLHLTEDDVEADIDEYDDNDDEEAKEISLATSAIATGDALVAAYDSDTDLAGGSLLDVGSPEWERRLALKYIRMLRLKKKDEHVPLVCRICEGQKCFTAQATLMYHYRSHAGIKPFVCGICQTTFTRQHSLNYHMLIHNNKSRFTCGDCGRQFRHPSHYKEHLRRHTGETPFECTECGVRFKTRNTYKRHLKTRHGKLLTVNGIVSLSEEEFMKVMTNPKRRGTRQSKRVDDTGYVDEEDADEEDLALASVDIEASGDEMDCDDETEDAIAVKALEQQQQQQQQQQQFQQPSDIVQAAVEAIIQDEALEQQDEEEGVAGDEDGALYTFYSIGVGRDPLNGKEIIVLEAVPQSSVRNQQHQSTTTTESMQQLHPIVQLT